MKKQYEVKVSDILDFASSQGIAAKDTGTEIKFRFCPYCHGGNRKSGGKRDIGTFSVNKKTGQFKCLRASCNAQGNMLTLARDFDFQLTDAFSRYYEKKPTYRTLKTPSEPIKSKPAAISYLAGRGISKATAEKYSVTCRNDDESILCFPIYDENKKIVNVKYRNTKFVKGKTSGSKEWFEKNCVPYLYGIQAWNGSFDQMVLYEGQIDAMSGYESGIENSFSVPGGANGFTWYPPSYDFISQFKRIIIFGDYEHNHITLLDEMKNRFGKEILYVRPENYKDCKDANEILLKYGSWQVKKCVSEAVSVPILDVMELADVEDVDIAKLEKLATGIKVIDELLYGGLPFGGVHIISGKPGEGKSTLASQILVNAISNGYKCFAYSGELPNYLFKAWIDFQVAGGRHVYRSGETEKTGYTISRANKQIISNWYRGKAFIYDNTAFENDEHADLLEATEKAICRYGCKVVLIDNLMTALDAESVSGDDKYERQSRLVKKMVRLAIKYNVLIILVAHKRKNNTSTNSNDEISGSGDISNLAMVTISYEKDKNVDEGNRVIKVAKNRLFGRVNNEGFVLQFDERSKRIYGHGDDPDKEYGCFAESDDGFGSWEDMEMIPF